MSETRNNRKPMPSIDAALREWPEAEKSASDWEERAESVMGRLRRGERGASAAYVSNEDLLSDPLGHSEEDGHKDSAPGAPVIHPTATPRTREGVKMQTIDRDRDRKSLQDLAKMAQGMTPPPSSVAAFGPVPSSRSVTNLGADANKKADDSGIVDLAAASAADPEAAMRAQTTPLASQSLFDDARDIPPPPPVNAPPASYAPPPPSGQHAVHAYQQPAPSVPPPPVASVPPPSMASVHPLAPSLEKKKSGAGALVLAFGSVLAIGAVAAGGFLYIRSHKAPEPTATAAAPAEVKPAVVAENKPAETAEPAKAAEPAIAEDGAMDLAALPNASSTKSGGAKVATRSAKPASAKAEPAEKATSTEDADKAKADKAKLDKALAGNDTPAAPAAPAGPPGDLGAAMNAASGGGKMQEQKPAAGSSGAGGGNVPQKPSQGAVTGALGAVLPAARDCLGPDDPISKASVVFNSDGSVASVSVSGSAAGKPAASCIEKQLRKAKLTPFAEPTYTANITIRHN